GARRARPGRGERLESVELGGRLGRRLPHVQVVDLRREAGYPLSAPLLEELGAISDKGGKAILLLNRRGIAQARHCLACGTTLRCPACDVGLTLHGDGALHCHHCGRREPSPTLCPACGAAELARLGAGTERLEQELADRLPGLRLIRLDADVASDPAELTEGAGPLAAAPRPGLP